MEDLFRQLGVTGGVVLETMMWVGLFGIWAVAVSAYLGRGL
jgi:hypothetical protein